MEIREPKSKAASAGLDWTTGSYSVAAKSLQILAEDITNISAASFERNAKLIDDLRGARTVEDLVSIQTKFMAGMFEAFNEHVRLMGARMADLRGGLTDAAQSATEAVKQTAPAAAQAGLDQALETTEEVTRASLKASQEMTKSAFEAAEKAADTIRNASRAAFSDESGPASHAEG